MDTAQHAHALGVATGRRETAERVVGELRKAVATWRASEAKPSSGLGAALRAAFFWAVTERWCARLETLAAQVDSDLAQLRTAEQQAQMQYQGAPAAAAQAKGAEVEKPPPVDEPTLARLVRAKSRGRKR